MITFQDVIDAATARNATVYFDVTALKLHFEAPEGYLWVFTYSIDDELFIHPEVGQQLRRSMIRGINEYPLTPLAKNEANSGRAHTRDLHACRARSGH
jgi:hypothetical protein